jgi:hypothetical protein
MAIASVTELVAQERRAGASDDDIARLLRASTIAPPDGHYRWTPVSVRALMGEDASGHRLSDGRKGGGH